MLQELISHLPDESLRRRQLAQGAWLFHQGDKVGAAYFVIDGCVELLRHMPDGKPAVLQRAGPGTMLAEASMFSERYHCDAIAAQSSLIAEVSRPRFVQLLGNDPDFATAWMQHLARQVQSARLRAEILTLKTVAQRLDAWLAFNDGKLPGRGAWSGLASEIGVSPEALYWDMARRRR